MERQWKGREKVKERQWKGRENVKERHRDDDGLGRTLGAGAHERVATIGLHPTPVKIETGNNQKALATGRVGLCRLCMFTSRRLDEKPEWCMP